MIGLHSNDEKKTDEKEEEQAGEKQESSLLEKAFLKTRSVFLVGEVNDKAAERICRQFFVLSSLSKEPIDFFVSSPGGHVESGDMIHDMVKFLRSKVRIRIIGSGWVASAGALIFVSAPTEDRYCLPNTRFLLHEPRGGVGGTASDIDIQAKEIIRMRERLNNIFAKATGQSLERIKEDTNRDYWMQAQEAKTYGLVGSIIEDMHALK